MSGQPVVGTKSVDADTLSAVGHAGVPFWGAEESKKGRREKRQFWTGNGGSAICRRIPRNVGFSHVFLV